MGKKPKSHDPALQSSDDGMVFSPDLPRGIVKEMLQEASSDVFGRPKGCDAVIIHCVGKLEETGVEFKSSKGEDAPDSFVLGKGEVIKGWELAVQTMRRGEVSKFTMDPEFAYGDAGLPPDVPPNAKVVFEIELVGYITRTDLFADGGAVSMRIGHGSGQDRAEVGDEVSISLTSTSSGPEKKEIERRHCFEYTIGSGTLGQVGKAVDKALRRMKRGDGVSVTCTKEYAYGDATPDGAIVEIVLEDIFETEDVSFFKDGSLMKKRMRRGEGYQTPEEGDHVKLLVEAASDGDGALLSFSGSTTLEFTWGDCEVAEIFELAATKMTKTERAIVTCNRPSLCREARLGLADLQAKKVVFALELVDFVHTKKESLGPEETIEFATARKDVGAKLFKQQKYRLAFARYSFVSKMMQEITQQKTYTEGDVARQSQEMETACMLNMAACLLKMGDLKQTISVCTHVLRTKPNNVKALFRRATAHHESGDHAQAIRDLTTIVEQDAQNAEARKLLSLAKQARKDVDKESMSTYTKMF